MVMTINCYCQLVLASIAPWPSLSPTLPASMMIGDIPRRARGGRAGITKTMIAMCADPSWTKYNPRTARAMLYREGMPRVRFTSTGWGSESVFSSSEMPDRLPLACMHAKPRTLLPAALFAVHSIDPLYFLYFVHTSFPVGALKPPLQKALT
ncbi:hypothetical protein F4777DRAFT_25958 [Nemania sp. FL0916]|nr:hypothetical protein F4777DRAFT_25958 [Nemania sp. FL0916]